uniref:Immunoglobulin V-set domain-containing protein n=1 Tax=Sinocyclocheilus anshuiensis TaxID=1608454 RepID=A0A671KED5_9TELE
IITSIIIIIIILNMDIFLTKTHQFATGGLCSYRRPFEDICVNIIGKGVTITCSHGLASTNIKYFCRDICEDRDVLVKSDHGRYRLQDFGNGTFTVNIIDLQESDSGIYWCGVKRAVTDTYNTIRLMVSKGKNDNLSPMSFPIFLAVLHFLSSHINSSESITISTQPYKETQTSLDSHTTTPAAHSGSASTTARLTSRDSSPDALKLSTLVTGNNFSLFINHVQYTFSSL